MEPFVQTRSDGGKKVYDSFMPKNAEPYGNSTVKDPDGNLHNQITHSKVLIWDADDPSKSLAVTIVSGDGAKSEAQTTGAGVIEYVIPVRGLCSVEVEAGRNLCVFRDVFPVWAG